MTTLLSRLSVNDVRDRVRQILIRLKELGQSVSSRRNLVSAIIISIVFKAYKDTIKEGPRVYCQRNEWTELIMALLSQPGKSSGGLKRFRPGFLTLNGHLSTLFSFLRALPPSIPCTREVVPTADGGQFALDWYNEPLPMPADPSQAHQILKSRPIVLILHGVNGHGDEPYMRHLAHTVSQRGWRAASMTFRGCGELMLTSPQAYDACKTEDVDQAVTMIHARFSSAPLFMVGFSLGANLMVKYLGQKGPAAAGMVAGAVSISNPWCFLPHIESIHYPRKSGLRIASRIYSMLLAHEYKRYVHRHSGPLADKLKEVTRPLRSMVTLRELDENVTVPLGGFRDLEHYMTESSCSEYLENVSVPLLGINALDDPFVSKDAVDHTIKKASSNPHVILVTTRQGGHIGWGEAFLHLWRSSWAERLCVDFLSAVAVAQGLEGKGQGKGTTPFTGTVPPRSRL